MKLKRSFLATGGYSNEVGILGLGTKQFKLPKKEFKQAIILLNYLNEEKSIELIHNYMLKKKIPESMLKKLIDANLIVSKDIEKTDDMDFKNKLYSQAISLDPDIVSHKLHNMTIIIAGCGGIGNFLGYALSTYTPEKLILIDGDKIERSNLNRQFLFKNTDIGDYKVNVLKRELNLRNPKLNISTINKYVTEETFAEIKNFKQNDNYLAILSGDSMEAVKGTTNFCVKNEIPFLNVGYLNDISVVGPFYIPNETSCPFCGNALSLDENKDSYTTNILDEINSRYEAPSSFTNNSLAASIAMSDILQYANGNIENIKSLNSRFGVDNVSFKTYTIQVPKDKSCKFCGENK